ncbi:MAG: DNA polymerase Y family protein [Steroidobacteraceae bacterium]|nr:DNA polymerase Y family protein [Steroidobacteraceae bacterium]
MLWIALHLPLLSLESFAATLPPELRRMPLALVQAQRVVTHVNAGARALGVKPGQRRNTALGLAPQLVTAAADPLRDARALQGVLHACLAFTPAVSAMPPDRVLLEVQASLRYFEGLEKLVQRLRAALAPLGHRVRHASAPTAQGAALLTLHGPASAAHCADLHVLHKALDAAPVHLLGTVRDRTREQAGALQGMGLHTLADLRRLPRAGLARRFGEALLDEIDRAYGERADPRVWAALPPAFESRLELFARADTSAQLLYGAETLLARLVAWLSAQHAFARRFTLQLQHEARRQRDDRATPAASAIEIVLAAPSRELDHLLLLLRERLDRTQLAAPVLDLFLHCDDIARAPPPNGELFASAQGEREGLTRLVERLQARLGRPRVRRLSRMQDHRPERGSESQEVDAAEFHTRPEAKCAAPVLHGGSITHPSTHPSTHPTTHPITRPVWLVEPAQPLSERRDQPLLDGAPLQLLSGPERIEAGWWDEGLTGRDYFIAQAADASLVWIYRLRLPSLDAAQGWYLHGRFA